MGTITNPVCTCSAGVLGFSTHREGCDVAAQVTTARHRGEPVTRKAETTGSVPWCPGRHCAKTEPHRYHDHMIHRHV